MKDIRMKTPFSIKLIYWMMNGLFWFLILAVSAQVIDQLLYLFGVTENPIYSIVLPLKTSLLPITEVEFNGVITPVKKIQIQGKFNSWDFDFSFAVLRTSTFYFNAFLLIYAIKVVKDLLNNVKKSIVFTIENVSYIKRVAYIFFLIWMIKVVFMQSYTEIYFNHFNPFNDLFLDYLLSNYLLIGAILLAVAYIFERGVKLQNYKDLTI